MESINPFIQSRSLVLKIGSALLVDSQTGRLKQSWLEALCHDIATARQAGLDIMIVSSGAVALGRARLGLLRQKLTLAEKQACAAAGQSRLTQAYENHLAKHNIQAAQVLFTLNDTENRRRWLNARSTLQALMGYGIVPIINENDTVATDEIRYGDNDRLAARTAQMLGADTLILLSDIDGLYTDDPRQNPQAEHLPIIETLSDTILAMAGKANQSAGVGTGGMVTKLNAAQIATQAGCYMCIMNGSQDAPLSRLVAGERVSWFKATTNPKDARRQWISGSLRPKGHIHIDAGAEKALRACKSLLPAGVTAIDGNFSKGDAVSIVTAQGQAFARGLIAYDAKAARKIMGTNTTDIGPILGYDNGPALIHKDNLVILELSPVG